MRKTDHAYDRGPWIAVVKITTMAHTATGQQLGRRYICTAHELVCGHTVVTRSRLTTEAFKKKRRCAQCAAGAQEANGAVRSGA